MGILTALGVEIVRAIKNRKKDPQLEYIQSKTLDVHNIKEFLYVIDYYIKIKDKEAVQEWIEIYLEHNKKDEGILKRISEMEKL